MDNGWLQAIGIGISAVASTTAAVLAVLRYLRDNRHVLVRLKLWPTTPDEDPTDASVAVLIFNQGRPIYLDQINLHIGKDSMGIRTAFELPYELGTGRSVRPHFSLSDFEGAMEEAGEEFGSPSTHTDRDLPTMRAELQDGEGHSHWAKLDRGSRAVANALVGTRRRLAAEQRV